MKKKAHIKVWLWCLLLLFEVFELIKKRKRKRKRKKKIPLPTTAKFFLTRGKREIERAPKKKKIIRLISRGCMRQLREVITLRFTLVVIISNKQINYWKIKGDRINFLVTLMWKKAETIIKMRINCALNYLYVCICTVVQRESIHLHIIFKFYLLGLFLFL